MEKLKFTIRFIILLAAVPVFMFTELTRAEKVTTGQKENTIEKISAVKSSEAMQNHSPYTQAVYN